VTRDIRERLLFLRSFLAHPRQIGAVFPTSRWAVRDTLDLVDFTGARCVVEFGAGTGVYTRELLARLRSDARLLAFEVDPILADRLLSKLPDPRLHVVNDSAENVEAYLNDARADVIISALPFTSLPTGLRRSILEHSRRALIASGVMLVLQYSPLIQPELRRVFTSVERHISPFNVPPAFLFACQASRPSSEGDR
jgi:phospholipid N-methyltransferase